MSQARLAARAAAMEGVNARHHLGHLFVLALGTKGQQGADYLAGLLDIVVSCVDALQKHGPLLTAPKNQRATEILGYLPQARAMHLSAICSQIDKEGVAVIDGIVQAVYECRDLFSFPEPAPGDTTAENSPNDQSIMRVQIVGMPERVTDTQVDRDRSGDITRTAQYERDATH